MNIVLNMAKNMAKNCRIEKIRDSFNFYFEIKNNSLSLILKETYFLNFINK